MGHTKRSKTAKVVVIDFCQGRLLESGMCLCTAVSLNKRMLVVKGIRNLQIGSAYGEVVYGECGSSEESKMKMEMKLDWAGRVQAVQRGRKG